jgi:predicted SAM-dependent methyltransferase
MHTWTCPICNFIGPFNTFNDRPHAQCPQCKSLERHRLQYLVFEELFREGPPASKRLLHFAPEDCFREYFSARVGEYITADLTRLDTSFRADLTALQWPDESLDIVYASHVLEHIKDDRRAIAEVYRVLTPGGIAVLPVPIVNHITAEYTEPNPYEHGHVRACGKDYFNRFIAPAVVFDLFDSENFKAKHQTQIWEDRSVYPTIECPQRQPNFSEHFLDYVPVLTKI